MDSWKSTAFDVTCTRDIQAELDLVQKSLELVKDLEDMMIFCLK